MGNLTARGVEYVEGHLAGQFYQAIDSEGNPGTFRHKSASAKEGINPKSKSFEQISKEAVRATSVNNGVGGHNYQK